MIAAVGIRRWQLRWGATQEEVTRRLPGDDIVVAPQYSATNAITVDAAPGAVWPWLVQMGAYGRAGWYAFDHLDKRRHDERAGDRPGAAGREGPTPVPTRHIQKQHPLIDRLLQEGTHQPWTSDEACSTEQGR